MIDIGDMNMKTVNVYQIKYTKMSLSGNREYVTNYMTLDCLKNFFGYTLECGRSHQNEKGNYKIKPISEIKTIKSLISFLNKSSHNSSRSYQSTFYELLNYKKVQVLNILKKVQEDSVVNGEYA